MPPIGDLQENMHFPFSIIPQNFLESQASPKYSKDDDHVMASAFQEQSPHEPGEPGLVLSTTCIVP